MTKTNLVDRLDHIVLTVNDIERTMLFYEQALGMERESFFDSGGQRRSALRFGDQKINLHDRATATPTKAHAPTYGSADFCLIATVSLERVIANLEAGQIPIEVGPVSRQGALGALRSVYIRDPDQNLVEVAEYVES